MKTSKESFAEYKIRVIDPVSPTFCAAKWSNSTIWLNQGSTSSCHHPAHQQIDCDLIQKNPAALHDTSNKIQARIDMLNGEQTPECNYCWAIENSDSNVVSDRVYKTAMFSDEDIELSVKNGPTTSILRTLEIAFDRTCNFACSYCSPTFSSSWVNDIKANGPYYGLSTDGREHYKSTADWAQPYPASKNPYIRAFWQWWPTLKHQLTELRITGGEPLLSKETWKVLDMASRDRLDMRLAINSNLGVDDVLIDELITATKTVKRFNIFTSCETSGSHAEYLRDGLNYEKWKYNVIRLLSTSKLEMLNVMMTMNALSLYQLTDFLTWIMTAKSSYRALQISVNILRNPEFMSFDVLPNFERQRLLKHISQWWDDHRSAKEWAHHEREQIDRMLSVLMLPSPDEPIRKSLEQDFVDFYSQYDARRGKSLNNVFPELWLSK